MQTTTAQLDTRFKEAADPIDRFDEGGLATRTIVLEGDTTENNGWLRGRSGNNPFWTDGNWRLCALQFFEPRPMWSNRTRAESTDPIVIPEQHRESKESTKEEVPTEDEAVASPGGLAA